MRALNLPHPDARVESLSGGEKRRVDLCRMLLGASQSTKAFLKSAYAFAYAYA